MLASFNAPASFSDRIPFLLEHETERHAMRKRAYLYGREMIWPEVAERYLTSFERAREERLYRNHPSLVLPPQSRETSVVLPAINLEHLWRLTDDTGILQHAVFTIPNYSEGYTTDDNARALGVSVLLEELGETWNADAHLLAPRYLAFLWHAFNTKTGRFRNFLGYDRRWLETIGSADSHGRALQNLGLIIGRSEQRPLRGVAVRLFEEALSGAEGLNSPRAWAFSLIGINEYLNRFTGDRMAQQVLINLAEQLFECYEATHTEDWPWFENALTYSNAVLSHALLVSGYRLNRDAMVDAALESLRWLVEVQRGEAGHFSPIGCKGFYPRGEDRACFDQQPVETQTVVDACLEAGRLTGDPYWRETAEWAFGWFLGQNDLRLPLYDAGSGGCHDGLHPDRVNQNQGAESTLAFLLSLLELRRSQNLLAPLLNTQLGPQPLGLWPVPNSAGPVEKK